MIRKFAGIMVGAWMTALLLTVPAWAGEVAVVANADLPLDRLNAAEVKKIFLGEKSFVGEAKIHPLDYTGTAAVRDAFFGGAMGLTPSAFDTYWLKEVFRSGRVPPGRVEDVDEMLRKVAEQPGAIGYVPVERLAGVTGIKRVLVLSAP